MVCVVQYKYKEERAGDARAEAEAGGKLRRGDEDESSEEAGYKPAGRIDLGKDEQKNKEINEEKVKTGGAVAVDLAKGQRCASYSQRLGVE